MAKNIYVTMPDASVWSVPARVVEQNRNDYYRGREKDFEDDTLDDFDIEDWAKNNMNWSDVAAHATLATPSSCDYQEGWTNGEMEIK